MVKIKISKTLQSKIRNGYPWVFNYQVLNEELAGSPGDLAVIYDNKNKFLALGIYDPFSELCFRVLTTGSPKTIDHTFFNERLQKALEIRRPLEAEGTTGYRIINGENDGFPGLILDRYRDSAVVKNLFGGLGPLFGNFKFLIRKRAPRSALYFADEQKRQERYIRNGEFSRWFNFIRYRTQIACVV